ncbi:MAG TPA: hypothetical protein VFU05_04045 [Cyclobacteriaceae bacterium]|nr:hypothetical protein [Cyclobacteriaceae bacterium]
MKTRWIILPVLVFGSSALFAQTYTFKVLVSKGKTEIKSANEWQSIKVGAALKATDEVRIAENAYLGLIHENGKPLELREAGSFKVSELVSRLTAGSSVLNKYTDFILSSDQSKKNRLSATGAVHRGIKDVIVVYLSGTDRADLYGDKLAVQWSSEEVKGPYEVVFTTLLDEELARFEATSNQLIVSMNEGNLKDEYEVMVKVVSKENRGKGSKDYVIKRMRPAAREKFTKIMDELKSAVASETALSKYYMAGIYEENFLLNDALTAYQEAIKLAPDVPLYQEAYKEFLIRLGF